MSFCGECGKPIPDGQTICPTCRERLYGYPDPGNDGKATNKGKLGVLIMSIVTGLFAVFFIVAVLFGNSDGHDNDTGTLAVWDEADSGLSDVKPGPSSLSITAPYAESLKANVMPETTAPAVAVGDYMLPTSNTEYLTKEMLMTLSDEQLQIARNEIYARHGRKFSTPALMEHFSSKSWYVPLYEPQAFDAMGNSMLNVYELYNLNLILEIEAQR